MKGRKNVIRTVQALSVLFTIAVADNRFQAKQKAAAQRIAVTVNYACLIAANLWVILVIKPWTIFKRILSILWIRWRVCCPSVVGRAGRVLLISLRRGCLTTAKIARRVRGVIWGWVPVLGVVVGPRNRWIGWCDILLGSSISSGWCWGDITCICTRVS